jgi:hypothetical protein
MRKFILLGATGVLLGLGAVSADAQSVLDRPSSSPYAILTQRPDVPDFTEGRSAFTAQDTGNWVNGRTHHFHRRARQ